MQPVNFLGVASAQVSQHPGSIRRVRGNFNGAGNEWLWLFDSNGQPAVKTIGNSLIVPTPVYAASPFFIDESHGSLEFTTGLLACLSTTQETFTQSASLMDITVELNDPEEPKGNTYAGDTTTGVDSLVVYASNPNKNLYALTVTNNTGATAYLQLFTVPAPTAGATPVQQWTLTNGQTLALTFSIFGAHPISGAYPNQTEGCYLFGSSTSNTFTATVAAGWKMQAEFGAPSNG